MNLREKRRLAIEARENQTIPESPEVCPMDEDITDSDIEAEEFKQALQDDATDLWRVTNAIKHEIESRYWITEGRGPYEWDDNRYKEEARQAFDAVLELIASVQHPAQKRFHEIMSG